MEKLNYFLQSPLLSASGPLAIILMIVLFWWRVGSIYSLLERLWRLIAGGADVSDTRLKSFMRDVRDLERFRFMYGLRVESKTELHAMLDWLKENSISIADAQQVKRWINIKIEPVIIKPTSSYFFKTGAMILLSFGVIIASQWVGSSKYAWLTMKETKISFLSDGQTVRSVLTEWSFNLDQCHENKIKLIKTGFSDKEISALCDAGRTNEMADFVKRSVEFQQSAALFVGLFSFLIMLIRFISLNAAQKAVKIHSKVSKNRNSENEGGQV
jgi:hypothetical protein